MQLRNSASFVLLLFSTIFWNGPLFATEKSLAEIAKKAIVESDLTQPGSKPFHLKARVFESTNPDNHGYDAEIEEYWVSPERWRRTVRSREFSSVLVVNGNTRSEERKGDYSPNWLRTIVSAVFEPGAQVNKLNFSASSDNPVLGGKLLCRRFSSRAGIPPVSNNVFYSICFEDGKLESVNIPGYAASYKEYKKFSGRQVAREVHEYIEPGTELEADILELTELQSTDESLFAVNTDTAPLSTFTVSEQTLRSLAGTEINPHWPPIRGGKTQGVLSVYVCLDRQGRIRESYALNSDHPDMSDAARGQLARVQFKPAGSEGELVQVEGILTFAYKTEIDDPYPVLTEAQAREMIVALQEPQFPFSVAKGTTVSIELQIGTDGKVQTTSAYKTRDGQLSELRDFLLQCYRVIDTWQFKPFVRGGKPTPYRTVLNFVAH